MVNVQERINGDRGQISFSQDEIVATLPDMIRVVAGDPSDGGASTISALFTVKNDADEVRESIEVEMVGLGDGSYRISPGSVDRFRGWLGPRIVELMRGNVALENVEGLHGPPALRLAKASTSAATVKQAGGAVEGGWLESARAGQELVGRLLAQVGFFDMEGKRREMSDFRGRVVLIHVWATWCAPCIAAMPALEALEGRYRDTGLTVVNLSDEPDDVIEEWLAANPTSMVHGRVDDFAFLATSEDDLDEQGMLRVRPVYVVLGRRGHVRAHRVGGRPASELKSTEDTDGGTSAAPDMHYLSGWVRPHLQSR